MEVKKGERGWNRLKLKQENFSESPFVSTPTLLSDTCCHKRHSVVTSAY